MILLGGVLSFLITLFGIYGAWELWGSNPSHYNLQIALKITGYGTALVLGSSMSLYFFNQWAKKQTRLALQKNHPVQPWCWRFDWVNGYSHQNMSGLYAGLVFSLLWTILLIPIIISKIDELPPIFFWIFAVGFPVISGLILLQQLFKWLRFFIYGRTTLTLNNLPLKQGKTGSVTLTGKTLAFRQNIAARVKVVFKYVSKTKDSDGTNYSNEEIELTGNDWTITNITSAAGKSIKLSGNIPDGYPDFGTKVILPQYSDNEGTVLYKLLIQSKSFTKKMDINYDLPVFSSIHQYPGGRNSGRVINDFRLVSSIASVLVTLLVLALYDANKLRHSTTPITSFLSEHISFVEKKYMPNKPESVLSANQLNSVDGMNGATRFMLIVRYQDIEQTINAFNAGADLYIRDDFGRIAIHHAVACHPNQKEGRTQQILTYLLSLDINMISAKDNSGRSPLYWAIDSACLEGVNALLMQGATVTPELVEAAKRERKRLHSRDNFVKEAVLNSEHIVEILQSM